MEEFFGTVSTFLVFAGIYFIAKKINNYYSTHLPAPACYYYKALEAPLQNYLSNDTVKRILDTRRNDIRESFKKHKRNGRDVNQYHPLEWLLAEMPEKLPNSPHLCRTYAAVQLILDTEEMQNSWAYKTPGTVEILENIKLGQIKYLSAMMDDPEFPQCLICYPGDLFDRYPEYTPNRLKEQ